MDNEELIYTYDKGRKCLNCPALIADQEHGSRRFCEEIVYDDGSIKNCKDDHHSQLRREEMFLYTSLGYYYRDVNRRIEELLIEVGEVVTLDDIEGKGIDLERNLKLVEHASGLHTFYFLPYAIQQITINQFKIIKHELLQQRSLS